MRVFLAMVAVTLALVIGGLKGAWAMELELVISVPDTNWISGESPTFSAVLINRGSEDVELPDAYAADMFSVSITDQASGLTRTIAPGELLFARNPDRKLPQFPVDVVPLAPGEQRDYLIDLNTYLNTPLVVGVHDILASYDTGEQKFDSAAITVTVAPLQAVSIVSSPEASARVLYQLVMHAEADSLTVLTRKSEINYPGEGGLVRAGEGVLPGASAAFATQVQALISHRHFAIHDSGALRFGEHSRGYHPTTSAPLSDAASLHPIGWQIDEWTSEFVALAAEGSGGRPARRASHCLWTRCRRSGHCAGMPISRSGLWSTPRGQRFKPCALI